MKSDNSAAYSDSTKTAPNLQRLIIKKASINIEVKDPLASAEKIKSIILRESGFIESSSNYNTESVSIKAKVPADKLDNVVNELGLSGKVILKDFSSQDVTEEMIDINARLKNLVELRNRFRVLLSKAESVKDVLSIESELTRLQSEIDSIEGRSKSLQGQVAYSSIGIRVIKKPTYGPLGYLVKGVYWGVKKLFIF